MKWTGNVRMVWCTYVVCMLGWCGVVYLHCVHVRMVWCTYVVCMLGWCGVRTLCTCMSLQSHMC